ncbi:MAG: VOC family protein [Ruminococcus sp.]|nr:VOC family protein [Ruminococcus sp.]
MRIEHAAVYYADLEAAKAFFEKYFSAKAGSMYHNTKTGFRSYFLTFDGGARLEIMSKESISQKQLPDSLGLAHIAFSLGSAEKVDSLTERLKNDGFSVVSGPRTTGDGYYESCIEDAEGNRIELTV